MNTRSAIHQNRPEQSRARSSSSQARTLLYGYTPETEIGRQPDLFEEGPPLSDFTRGLPKRNRDRAPSGQRSSIPSSAGTNGAASRLRSPSSVVEKMRGAGSRRPSTSSSDKVNNQSAARKRGPSLVAKARELMIQSTTHASSSSSSLSSSFHRRLDQQHLLSRHDDKKSASEDDDEKVRLSIEAKTPCFNLVQRWKDLTDWLEPSGYWKKTHPAMNFRLWRILARKSRDQGRLKASVAQRHLEDATRLFELKGGDSRERWPEGLEEEVLDSWALGFGGQDPPRREWWLEKRGR